MSAVADRIPGFVYQRIQHPDGREEYNYISPGFRDTFGIEPAELFADPTILNRAIHPKDREHRDRAIAESARTLSDYDVQYRALTPTGETKWLHATARPSRRADGAIVWTGITLDVTEWKESEARLHESEARYRSRFDSIPISVWEEDWSDVKKMIDRLAAGGVSDWQSYFESHVEDVKRAFELCKTLNINRATLEMYGAPNQENAIDVILGPSMTEAESRKFTDWIVSFANCNSIFISESEEPRVDGSTFHARVRSHIPPEYADTWDRVITTVEDITERRKAEETVRTRDSWLRAILENAPIQIVLKDTVGRIMAISRNTGEMLGTAMDEFLGRTTADFLPEDVAGIYMTTDREVVATGRAIQQEVFEDWDGTARHFLNSKFPLRDDDGRIIGVCSLTSDITESKRAEARLRQAQKMEAVGQLTGGVAHDFNNLLAVILGNAELLRERLDSENRLDAVDRQIAAVVRAARRGAELTQRLLAFSRRQPLQPLAIDLAGQVAGMTELLTRTLGATIEITVASTPELWPALADPGQLENALLNLALNARDAMAEGGRLSISSANVNLNAGEIAGLLAGQASEAAMLEPGQPGGPGDYVVLSVSDTGTGMSAAVLAQVFDPFFTTKDVGQGSGLGLSMVYGFARQSGGFAEVESVPGRGTHGPALSAARIGAGARRPGPP